MSPIHQLLAKRTEELGCHLTVMELYEKVFMALWIWIVFLMVITAGYLVYLAMFWLPYFRTNYVHRRYKTPPFAQDGAKEKIASTLREYDVGDTFVLARLRGYLSNARFYVVLVKLAALDPENCPEVVVGGKGGSGRGFAPTNKRGGMPAFPMMGGHGGGAVGWQNPGMRGQSGLVRR